MTASTHTCPTCHLPDDVAARLADLGVRVDDEPCYIAIIRSLIVRSEYRIGRTRDLVADRDAAIKRAERAQTRLENEGRQHTRAIIAERQRDDLHTRATALEKMLERARDTDFDRFPNDQLRRQIAALQNACDDVLAAYAPPSARSASPTSTLTGEA